MKDAYEDFKENREEARLVMRAAIARQTLDTSNRGQSVRHALRLYCGVRNMGSTETARRVAQILVRMEWNHAYRQARKQDAAARDRQAHFFRQWAPVAVEMLLESRKIDELLGRPE